MISGGKCHFKFILLVLVFTSLNTKIFACNNKQIRSDLDLINRINTYNSRGIRFIDRYISNIAKEVSTCNREKRYKETAKKFLEILTDFYAGAPRLNAVYDSLVQRKDEFSERFWKAFVVQSGEHISKDLYFLYKKSSVEKVIALNETGLFRLSEDLDLETKRNILASWKEVFCSEEDEKIQRSFRPYECTHYRISIEAESKLKRYLSIVQKGAITYQNEIAAALKAEREDRERREAEAAAAEAKRQADKEAARLERERNRPKPVWFKASSSSKIGGVDQPSWNSQEWGYDYTPTFEETIYTQRNGFTIRIGCNDGLSRQQEASGSALMELLIPSDLYQSLSAIALTLDMKVKGMGQTSFKAFKDPRRESLFLDKAIPNSFVTSLIKGGDLTIEIKNSGQVKTTQQFKLYGSGNSFKSIEDSCSPFEDWF